jgi:hypothetical protein
MTLVGFLRGERFNTYAGFDRILPGRGYRERQIGRRGVGRRGQREGSR